MLSMVLSKVVAGADLLPSADVLERTRRLPRLQLRPCEVKEAENGPHAQLGTGWLGASDSCPVGLAAVMAEQAACGAGGCSAAGK